MKPSKDRGFILFLLPFVLYAGVVIAPYMDGGLPNLLRHSQEILDHPFRLRWCALTPKVCLIMLLIYGIYAGVVVSEKRDRRYKEEKGSARLSTPQELRRTYLNKKSHENLLFTRHCGLSFDTIRHGRNLNVLVCGGSGSGKSRYYVRPNLLEANANYVVLDPKGELLRSCGTYLTGKGYTIKVLNLLDFEKGNTYNPLEYLKGEESVQRLVTNFFNNTGSSKENHQDPFWEESAKMLMMALLLYIKEQGPGLSCNLVDVMKLLHQGAISNGEKTKLDETFEALAQSRPESCALKYYRSFNSGTKDIKRSIQITLMSRLNKLNIPEVAGALLTDEMELERLGSEEKMALFLIIPDNDASFNFLVGMLYTQLFQLLYSLADARRDDALPRKVHFLMDEFANCALPEDFDKLLSTMRSRNISVSILLQNMAQLKALYPHSWESVVGNCDSFLYLGGNERSTHEYISDLIGEATIEVPVETTTKTGVTRSKELLSRSILNPEEVRLLENRCALLFIRGSRPTIDEKMNSEQSKTFKEAQAMGEYRFSRPSYACGHFTMQKIREHRPETARTAPEPSPFMHKPGPIFSKDFLPKETVFGVHQAEAKAEVPKDPGQQGRTPAPSQAMKNASSQVNEEKARKENMRKIREQKNSKGLEIKNEIEIE